MTRDCAPARGERAAVLAAALVWLVLLAFPVIYLVGDPLAPLVPATLVPATLVPAALLGVLLAAYLRAVVLIAWDGAPRSRPVELIVVVVIAVGLPLVYGAAWFGATVFLASLIGLSAPPLRALLGVVAASVVAVLTGVSSGAPGPQLLSVPLVTALAGVVVVVVIRQAVLGRELARLTAEAERLRLARELHDSVKQHAFVAAMELGAARTLCRVDDPELVARLDAAATAVSGVQRRLSGVLDELRAGPTELGPALRRFVEDWSRRTGLEVELDIGASDGAPSEPLLPVAAEALINVERHAGASRVSVALHLRHGCWRLHVGDDGAGFDSTAAGHGIRGMRERLASHGGTLDVRSGPGGTTVYATSPR